LIHADGGELSEPGIASRLHVWPVLLGGVGGLFFRGRFRAFFTWS
jgi:hypothetical protein